ncbi:MAG TPA: amidohydrolase, partial [bacterium]|nr:amidohydrolase [bacterium]
DFPEHAALTAVSPDHFIVLERVDGHAVLVNQNVLTAAKINRETPDPRGGKIMRNAQGEPTGVLIDNAIDLLIPYIPKYTLSEDSLALEAAMSACLKVGLTSVHDAGVDTNHIDVYKELGRRNKLCVRVYAMLNGFDRRLLDMYYKKGPEKNLFNQFLTIASIKLYSDGALGSRGAALLEPYSDSPQSKGLELMMKPRLEIIATDALKWGFQVCTHAIGDRGNRNTLDAYEAAMKAVPDSATYKRFRIEHAQVVNEADIPRFATLGVIASMQPTHCTSDMYWAEERVGKDRIRGAYAWQKFIKNGVRLAAGSDAPVESHNPLLGVYAAVTRQDAKGWPPGGWYPDQKLSILEALRAFTIDAAYAGFEETQKGSLTVGKMADIVVLSKDITTADPREILNTHVVWTMVGGKIVYRQP